MEKNKLELVKRPEEKGERDSLTELLRIGAKKLISQAVEAELKEMLSSLILSWKMAGDQWYGMDIYHLAQYKQELARLQ